MFGISNPGSLWGTHPTWRFQMKVNLAVIYYSATGSVHQLAEAVADGPRPRAPM